MAQSKWPRAEGKKRGRDREGRGLGDLQRVSVRVCARVHTRTAYAWPNPTQATGSLESKAGVLITAWCVGLGSGLGAAGYLGEEAGHASLRP